MIGHKLLTAIYDCVKHLKANGVSKPFIIVLADRIMKKRHIREGSVVHTDCGEAKIYSHKYIRKALEPKT